jgi:hypothetical protein
VERTDPQEEETMREAVAGLQVEEVGEQHRLVCGRQWREYTDCHIIGSGEGGF